MTRDDIIRMARETQSVYATETWTFALSANQLEHFAALVAADEREAFAKLCEDYNDDRGTGETWGPRFAAIIRARNP